MTQTNKWLTYSYKLPNNILTIEHIKNAITDFNNSVLYNLKNEDSLVIMFKIRTEDNILRSISYLQRINKLESIILQEVFMEFWNLKMDNYQQLGIKEIIFNYYLKDKEVKISKSIINKPYNKKSYKPNLLQIGGYNLPQTMNLFEWGDVDFILNEKEALVYKKYSKAQYHVLFNKMEMAVKYLLNNKTVMTFTDKLLDINNLSTFMRTIKNQTFYFTEGKLDYKERKYIFPIIRKISPRPFLINKFITMDLETYNDNGNLVPYAVSIYDGKKFNFFYLTDYKNSEDLLISAVLSLMQSKYNGFKVYLHNFSNFDGVFLLNILTKLSNKIDIIINDGRFINITFHYGNGKYKLYFRDSLLMLPSSLRKLSVAFNVEDKGIFPYNFVYKDNLDYEGEVPEFKYFNNINNINNIKELQYQSYLNNYKYVNWNLRQETEKYCNNDCLVLYEILDAFFKENFNNTRINASKYVSLPSLAFANYRSTFLRDDIQIFNIKGNIYNFIKENYFGGAVDVYKPFGKNIYRYDVNSLYPFIMKNNNMPVGKPTLIEGNVEMIFNIIKDPNKFSFVEVDVYCPEDIKAPLLLHRFNNKTIAPTGTWSGVYSSIEINRALELGYTFTYHKAVYFKAENIFKDYVDYYFNMKKNTDKNSPLYTMSKLFLNSLYGRFGMSPYNNKHVIANCGETDQLIEKNTITEVLPLDFNKELISYFSNNEDELEDNNSKSCIAISASITAGARVFMSYFKNMADYTLYYSDTDSIDLDKPLPDKYVGTELGQFKLEHVFEEAVYIAPKMYGGKAFDYELVRVKGLTNPINFTELKRLLKKGSTLSQPNQKWYKNYSEGSILIRDEIYTLGITENKRQLIYDSNNTFIDTRPIKLSQ